jgi:hypothetical protein
MKETGPLDLRRTNSANTILEFLARNLTVERPCRTAVALAGGISRQW